MIARVVQRQVQHKILDRIPVSVIVCNILILTRTVMTNNNSCSYDESGSASNFHLLLMYYEMRRLPDVLHTSYDCPDGESTYFRFGSRVVPSIVVM